MKLKSMWLCDSDQITSNQLPALVQISQNCNIDHFCYQKTIHVASLLIKHKSNYLEKFQSYNYSKQNKKTQYDFVWFDKTKVKAVWPNDKDKNSYDLKIHHFLSLREFNVDIGRNIITSRVATLWEKCFHSD